VSKLIGTDFGNYKDRYKEEVQRAVSFVGQNVDFFTEVKARCLGRICKRYLGPPSCLHALDVGCGVGLTDCFLAGIFGELHGVDINEGVIEKAVLTNPSVYYQVYDGKRLPFADRSMDVIFTICVMHHIAPADWLEMVHEFRRVTRKDGLVIVFEHNPFNPLTRRVVSNCEFDADAVLLKQSAVKRLMQDSGIQVIEGSYILFLPFRGTIFSGLDQILKWLPLGAQYYVVGRKT